MFKEISNNSTGNSANKRVAKDIFIIFLSLAFFSSSISVYAEDALSLGQLIEEAKRNNPEILAAYKRYEASKARIPQAKALEDPTIGFTFEKVPGSPFRFSKSMPEDRMLSISQMLPFFGKLPLKGKIALVESQMYASEFKNKELEVINAVKTAYYDLFMNHKETVLSEESLVFLEDLAKVAETKYILGEVRQGEIFKINLEIAALSNNISNLRQERKAKETRLNSLLNREAESGLGVSELINAPSFNKDINYLYKLTLENQPELLIFSYAIERNKYAKSLAKRSVFPDLMSSIVMRGIASGGSIGPWDLMLAFSVPLWFWSKQRYQIKEAVANLEEAQAAYVAMKNKALSETKDLYAKVEISQNKIKLYKDTQIPLLESSLESSLSGYRAGKVDIMMLLETERMLVETKMSYYKAIAEYNMNLAELERTVGKELSEVEE